MCPRQPSHLTYFWIVEASFWARISHSSPNASDPSINSAAVAAALLASPALPSCSCAHSVRACSREDVKALTSWSSKNVISCCKGCKLQFSRTWIRLKFEIEGCYPFNMISNPKIPLKGVLLFLFESFALCMKWPTFSAHWNFNHPQHPQIPHGWS